MIRKAVIPAAGLGTRFLPITKVVPKEFLPIVDKPTIHYVVKEVLDGGIKTIILVIGRGKEAILNYYDLDRGLEDILREKGEEALLEMIRELAQMGGDLVAVRQRSPRGLGDAVLCVRNVVGDEPFAVLLGDDIIEAEPNCLQQMIDVFERYRGCIVAVTRVPPEEVHRYGVVAGEEVEEGLFRVREMVEKPPAEEAPSNLAIVGRYILLPEIFSVLESLPPGRGGEIQLTDALAELSQSLPVYGYLFKGKRFDAGDKLGYLKANISFALGRPEFSEELIKFMKDLLSELEGGGEKG